MKITQAVLPVAGIGTRFLPWTKVVPKELLPIGNQPIIALLVDECLSVGITDICFVISRGKEAIAEYFWKNEDLEQALNQREKIHYLDDLKRYDSVDFHVVYQHEQLGDGHALMQAKDWVRSDTVAVLFGDDLFAGEKNGLQQMVKAYETLPENSALLALENIPREDTNKYGIVETDPEYQNGFLHKAISLIEKPDPRKAPSTLGIVGRYLVPKSTFDIFPTLQASHKSELRLIDALSAQLGSIDIYGLECRGNRFDTGTPGGYRKAVEALG